MTLGTWYCSGANELADMLGLADAGHALGVCIPRLAAPARRALRDLEVPVFLDTGAFSEVDIGPDGPVVVHPMGPECWEEITAIQLDITAARRAPTLVVAPDRVGDQGETLARIERWVPRLRAIEERGGTIVLPCQRGAMPLQDFGRAIIAAAGLRTPALGIPANKAPATGLELQALVRATRPAALHLLGCGPGRRHAGRLVAAACLAGHRGPITCDSNGIAARVGRTNGPRGAPRILTRAQDDEGEEARAACWRGGYGPDYTDEIGDMLPLLGPRARDVLLADLRAVGYEPGIDLAAWLRQCWDDPVVAHLVDRAWARWYRSATRGIVRRRAVTAAFSSEPRQGVLPSV
jgi:hypothetical protein